MNFRVHVIHSITSSAVLYRPTRGKNSRAFLSPKMELKTPPIQCRTLGGNHVRSKAGGLVLRAYALRYTSRPQFFLAAHHIGDPERAFILACESATQLLRRTRITFRDGAVPARARAPAVRLCAAR
jgi:hypothetical protein